MKKAIQFGAGNIGRGFLGYLFSQAGYEVVFVEVVPEIARELNIRRKYIIRIIDRHSKEITVKNVRAVDGNDVDAVADEIAGADIAATAVGVNVLKNIVPALARGLEKRAEQGGIPIDIIIAENMLDAPGFLRKLLLKQVGKSYKKYVEEKVGLVATVIARMIPLMPDAEKARDPLSLWAEGYSVLPVDRQGFVGKIPDIPGIVAARNFSAYEQRKLFIHNAGHAVCAYLGHLHGYGLIWQAIRDEKIRSAVYGAMTESSLALQKAYKFPAVEMAEHVDDLISRFSNQALGDTIFRVARDPRRKLLPSDRLVGAARFAESMGVIPENISSGIAAAILYTEPGDEASVALQEEIKSRGYEKVIRKLCGIRPDENLGKMIAEKIRRFKGGTI